MNSPVIRPVILCGGSGTRLWPLSRTHYPKQFLRLVDDCLAAPEHPATTRWAAGARQDDRGGQRTPSLPGRRAVPRDRTAGRHPARTGRPQHGAGGRRGRAAGDWRSRRETVLPCCWSSLRSRDRRCGGFSGSGQGGRSARRSRVLWSPLACRPDRPETGYGYIRRGEPLAGGYPSTASSRSRIRDRTNLPRFR
jgi:mannose-1-phosphate guanylyltransferase